MLMSERMRRLAPVIAALTAGGMVALLMPAAWMRLITFVGTVAIVGWLTVRGSDPPR
jgi:hypothetical protein